MILSQAIDSLRVLLALHDSSINGASAIDTNDARIANDLIPAMGALLGKAQDALGTVLPPAGASTIQQQPIATHVNGNNRPAVVHHAFTPAGAEGNIARVETAQAVTNLRDTAGIEASMMDECKRIVNDAHLQPRTGADQAATAVVTANAFPNAGGIVGVDTPTQAPAVAEAAAAVEQGQRKRPPELLLQPDTASTTANAGPSASAPSDARLRAARARADGEETIHPGDQWFNGECPAGASNPSPTPLGKRTASGASSIVLQPSAKKLTRSVASAWASEADKYWAHINHLDFENVPPKPMKIGAKNRLSDPKTFTYDHELSSHAGWRGSESSGWSVYWHGNSANKPYYRSPDGEVYRSLVDCRRAHYRQQLAMFDDLGSLKSFGSNSLGSLGAIGEFLKMEVGGKEEV
jgi:hypothetical protein